MKITPLEIRQKTFEKVFRGYNIEDVNAFMESLSQVWDATLAENRELRIRLENAEKEVQKLREVEDSLFKTLKTAEDTSASMLDQATKKANLQVREAEIEAEALIKEAKWRAKTLIEEAEDEAKKTYNNLQKELKTLEREQATLDNEREVVLAHLRDIATEVLEKVQKFSARSAKAAIQASTAPFRTESHKSAEDQTSRGLSREEVREERRQPEPARSQEAGQAPSHNKEDDSSSSFFDQLG